MKNTLFKSRDFKLFFAGELVSNLGDQFTFIALPWLVLKLTNDPMALGITLALAGIPRAILMLFGGAITDKFSPRIVMLLSNVFRFFIVTAIAIIVLTNHVELWMVYLTSILFGIADAFFYPAQTTIITKLAEKEDLQQANTIVQGSAQICIFIGPLIVGELIAVIEKSSDKLTGIGIALALDAISFIISVITLIILKEKNRETEEKTEDNIIKSIKTGLQYSWHNKALRYILFTVTALNFFLAGPFFISIPIIAKEKLSGADAYGTIMSMWGIGALIGYILAGVIKKPKPQNFSYILYGTTAFIGIFLSLMAYSQNTLEMCILTFFQALISGFTSITAVTWIQQRIEEKMMGRIMSIIMFSSVGLIPVSQMLSSFIVKINLQALLVGAGTAVIIVSILGLLVPEVRKMGYVEKFTAKE